MKGNSIGRPSDEEVHTMLKFAVPATYPCTLAEVDRIKGVQRMATKLVKGLDELKYEDRITCLGLFSLSYKRI